MTVPVSLDQLKEEVARFGSSPYLLTVTDDHRAHAVSVQVAWDDAGEALTMGAGRSTGANARARPDVTLLWPPYEPGGYSLIVDGSATVTDELVFRPRKAVLHRSAVGAPGADGQGDGSSACGNDCISV